MKEILYLNKQKKPIYIKDIDNKDEINEIIIKIIK